MSLPDPWPNVTKNLAYGGRPKHKRRKDKEKTKEEEEEENKNTAYFVLSRSPPRQSLCHWLSPSPKPSPFNKTTTTTTQRHLQKIDITIRERKRERGRGGLKPTKRKKARAKSEKQRKNQNEKRNVMKWTNHWSITTSHTHTMASNRGHVSTPSVSRRNQIEDDWINRMTQKSVFSHRNDMAELAKKFGAKWDMICHICGSNSMKFLNRSDGFILFHVHWKNCHEQIHVVDENGRTKRGRICSHMKIEGSCHIQPWAKSSHLPTL